MCQYRKFPTELRTITPANFTDELKKIELPYFAELVKLISLEQLYIEAENRIESIKEVVHGDDELSEPVSINEPEEIPEGEPKPVLEVAKPKKQRLAGKRSYTPAVDDKHYSLLVECINTINLFRRPATAGKINKLLKGRLPESLEVTNQKSLTYLFDQLAENKFIKDTWISIADKNRDFISFRRDASDDNKEPHYIGTQQLSNCRQRNKREYIEGLDTIDEMIETMLEGK